jgi:hypothetical protein
MATEAVVRPFARLVVRAWRRRVLDVVRRRTAMVLLKGGRFRGRR